MAQEHKEHPQLTGKYQEKKAGREKSEIPQREKTTVLTTASGDNVIGYAQVINSTHNLSSEASRLPEYIASAGDAVKLAQEQVRKAQEQLREAQDFEKAVLELAQLQEVRQVHQELYGPDKETGLTAAQHYLAFKKTLREQPK